MRLLLPLSLFFLVLCSAAEGKNRMLDSLYQAGTSNLYDGNFDEAFSNFYQCKNLSEELKDSSAWAESLRYLGEVCRASQQFNLGLIYLNESLTLSRTIRDSLNIARALNRLAALKFEKKDVKGTMEDAKTSLSLSEHFSDAELSANNLNIIGALYTGVNNFTEAINYYERAREISLTLKNRSDLPNILINIANNYWLLKQYQNALPYAQQAFDLATKNKTLIYRLEACKQIMNCYKDLGNYEKAFQYSEQAAEINREYLTELKNAASSVIVLQDQNERANTENAMLKKSRDEAERLLKIQQTVSWIIIAGLFLVSCLLILVLVLYRQRRDSLQTLREQNTLVENQKIELQQLNQLKDTLLSVISHDFRSPLVTLHSMVQLLDMGIQTPEQLKEITGRLSKQIHETIGSLDNIIFWSRTQMQGFKIKKETFNLRTFSDEIVKGFQPELYAKHLSVENKIPEDNSISCDREILRIILRNLFSNAIKFSHPDGVISLFMEKQNSDVKISLQDQGMGISTEIKEKLFSHQHITTRGTHNEKGTGMGLILTRALITKLGGTINVTSVLNRGSTFTVVIP